MTTGTASDEVTDAIAHIEMQRQEVEKESGRAAACSEALRKLHELLEQEKAAPEPHGPGSGYLANTEAVMIEIRRVKNLAGTKIKSDLSGNPQPRRHHQVSLRNENRPPRNKGRRTMGAAADADGRYSASSAGRVAAMKLERQDLDKIAGATLEHYDERAEDFWAGTRDHDVSQNIAALLCYIKGEPPFAILDFGCGPGRDLKAFAASGHRAIGLEGAARFAAMARAHSGCDVWEQDFLRLDLPAGFFDGVFANAALFHVPGQELPRVLRELHATLKPGGVLFASNPRGNNEEGWNGGRYCAYHDLEAWRRYLTAAGFAELTHYYRPAGLPRARQPWLATAWRRPRS